MFGNSSEVDDVDLLLLTPFAFVGVAFVESLQSRSRRQLFLDAPNTAEFVGAAAALRDRIFSACVEFIFELSTSPFDRFDVGVFVVVVVCVFRWLMLFKLR